LQRLCEEPHFRLQESIKLPSIADRVNCDTRFHPAPKLDRKAVPKHWLHPVLADRIERRLQKVKSAETLQLELAEADVVDVCRTQRRPRCKSAHPA